MENQFCFVVCFDSCDWTTGHSTSTPIRVFLSHDSAKEFVGSNPNLSFIKVPLVIVE